MHPIVKILTAAFVMGLAGCKVTPPSKVESRTIAFAKHHVFVRNKSQKNPLAYTRETWEDGKEAFSHYCVACHGNDGQNTGVPFADHISPPIPSLASQDVQGYTDGQLKWILDNGIYPSGMPSSKGILSDDELWSIVVFLRHLPPAGSQGVPEMYTH
ncbi:MAG TPA: cytochrome c [Edaphobacter sp.]|nr:cytochrome c [Edaphobacter sp.]